MVASGTFGYGVEYAQLLDLNQLGFRLCQGRLLDHQFLLNLTVIDQRDQLSFVHMITHFDQHLLDDPGDPRPDFDQRPNLRLDDPGRDQDAADGALFHSSRCQYFDRLVRKEPLFRPIAQSQGQDQHASQQNALQGATSRCWA